MALNLRLAEAYVDIRVDTSKLGGDFARVRSQVSGLGSGAGGGLAQAVSAGLTQGIAQGGGQARDALGRFVAQGIAQGMASGMAQAGRGGGIGGGVGQGLTGLVQGLGLSSFATNPAMAAGQMAGGAVRGGIGLLADGLRESADTAMHLESTFADLQRVTGKSAEDVSRFKQTIFDIAGTQAGVSVGDLTGIALAGAKAGVADREGLGGLERFTRSMARVKNALGSGEGLNTEKMTEDMTRMLYLFGEGTDYIEGFGSALTRMANVSTSSAGDILDTSKGLSGTFASLSMSIPQVMAISSVISDVGLSNKQGASSFSQIFRMMASESEEMATKIGMPVERFQQVIRTDAMGALELLIAKFKELNDVDPIKAQEFLKGLGFEGVRTAGAFQQVASMIGEIRKRTAMAEEEVASKGALGRADEIKSATAQGEVGKLGNAFVELKDAVGENLLPGITAASGAMASGVRGTARAMPAIIAGVGMAAEAGVSAVGGAPASGAIGLARAAMGWFTGPDSAPAIPGKATGMRPAAIRGAGGEGIADWGTGEGGKKVDEQLTEAQRATGLLEQIRDRLAPPGWKPDDDRPLILRGAERR